MFTKRIIPCLDVNNGRVVKGVNFVQLRDAGDPVEIAKAYDAAGADELVFLDITASCEQRDAADIGIVGKDTILEEGRKLYEVMDLGFGKCKMCVCGPESAREVLENNQLIRVATKYPNIAKDYFFNRKHQTVDLIKLNGSIELAPIVGLSEVIVDIVETGSTLKENGLKVLEEVCPLSARMVVNQVSMKMENERIRKLIEDLRRVLQEEM